MIIQRILLIEDDPLIMEFMQTFLNEQKFSLSTTTSIQQAKQILDTHPFDLIISDMNLPDGSGLDILKYTKAHSIHIPTIVITGYGTIQNAVEAMIQGAFHYITKPFSPDMLLTMIQKAEEHHHLVQENLLLKSPQFQDTRYPLIAQSHITQHLLKQAKKIAKSSANIFLHGESGCGKEVFAQFIHNESLRSNKPYIKVNCAAIPDTLIESEFFGHEQGSFTGATKKRIGRFELANQGTLLLDEVTEIPLPLQAKLLRVIQEKEFERVGGNKTLAADVRILATSNRNLQEAVKAKLFREDLFYRLNVIPLHIPPLRERQEDILPLTQFFVEKYARMNGIPTKTLTSKAQQALLSYEWPGNIRELSNVIERAIILESGPYITHEHLYL